MNKHTTFKANAIQVSFRHRKVKKE